MAYCHAVRFSLPFALLLLCSLSRPAVGLYSSKSPVKLLNAKEFNDKVVKSTDIWIVEFFANWCGHCKSFAPEYEKAAKALKEMVRVVAVEDEAAMAQFGVKGFPTIKAIIGSGGKGAPKTIDFNGARDAKSVVEFAMKQATQLALSRLSGSTSSSSSSSKKGSGSMDVIVLTDTNFDQMVMQDEKNVWFVMFYAPWCGHCKALHPDWDKLASSVKGKAKIGKVDATTENSLGKRFEISGFPTLKLFPAGKKSDSTAEKYDGPRSADEMSKFVMKFYRSNAQAEQLLNDDQFAQACKTGLCVMAFLPHILDSKASGRHAYLSDLNFVVKASGNLPANFFWLQGGDQQELEEQLNLAFGFPAVVAVNLDKEKYAVHRGDFSQDSIKSFLSGLMAGSVPVVPLPKPLKKFRKIEKWDGKDAEPPKDEETGVDDEL